MLPTVEFMTGTNSLGSSNGVGRAMKKVCTRLELQLDKDDLIVDRNGQKVQRSKASKASYKSTLLGASSENDLNVFKEENFALTEGDVLVELVKGVPSITFFE
ncbi:hypothetical protein PVK06_036091 [Gossypium arboreum]|uniref:Uncharacterized protein n=1 Tax=Gossypium arboreum TaxID=29729 RepID=A0ABR0NJP8_GOSAR|nr:hypothetical protein PVK06_036091 [Gossypium arboreum]